MSEDKLPIISDEYGRDLKGRFSTGNTGKPKGASNKATKEVRQIVTNFLNDKTKELNEIWDSLDQKDKATLFIHLYRMVIPKPSIIEEFDNGINQPSNVIRVEIIPPLDTDEY